VTLPTHRRKWAATIACCVLFAAGADCRRRIQLPWATTPVPQVLAPNPSIEDVARAVNGNAALVRSMSASYATLSSEGAPSLRASISIEKPGRFRVRGSHALTGPELDLGSNDELFWLWLKRAEPPTMYFARHAQQNSGAMRKLLPLSPSQLVDAFGTPTIDPQASHQGPFQQGPDRLAIRSQLVGADGQAMFRTLVIDARSAWVLEQQLHDAAGNLLATVTNSSHRRDETSQAWLPHSIGLSIPSGKLSMTLYVDRWDVNLPLAPDTWQKPEQQGYPNVDLGDPRNMPPAAQSAPPQVATGLPPIDQRTRYGERSHPLSEGNWQADRSGETLR